MAGTDGSSQLAQTEVGDPSSECVIDSGGKQAISGLQFGHTAVYHMVHRGLATEKGANKCAS